MNLIEQTAVQVPAMEQQTRLSRLGESLTTFFSRRGRVGSNPPRLTAPSHNRIGEFAFEFSAPAGSACEVFGSADLRTWDSLALLTSSGGAQQFVDANAPKFDVRFYRVATEGVESVNLLGQCTVVIPPGFSMLSNPFMAADNTIAALLRDMPEGATFNKFDTTLFKLTKNSVVNGGWANPTETIIPGEGGIISNPTQVARTVRFSGQVGSGELSLPIPSGFSIRSSMAPLPGQLDTDLCFPAMEGDIVHQFDPGRQQYTVYTFEKGRWTPETPFIRVAESFWVGKTAAGNWSRSLNIPAVGPAKVENPKLVS